MPQSEKGFAPLIIILGIVVILGVAVGIRYFRITKNNPLSQNQFVNTQNPNSQQQDNIAQKLGCNSYQTCKEICQKPENASLCQSLMQQMKGNIDYALAGDGGDSSAKDLPACTTNAIFDHLPTSDINSIEGMGHMFGEHIMPVQADHIYLYPVRSNTNVTVYSPGDVTLVQVVAQNHTGGMDIELGTDYAYFFSSCKSVMFGFIHVRTISDKIKQALTTVTPKCDQGTLASNCVYQDLELKLNSGEVIGTAWGGGNALDFGGTDVRTPTLGFINKQDLTGGMLGDSYFHTICPLDYFTNSLKTQLYSSINIKNAGVNGIPACGLIMQDKVGTAQGNWYQPGTSNTGQGDSLTKLLALAHSNLDPSQAVLSAGSKLLPSSGFGAQILYQPRTSGFINRDPANIKPDGYIYCIEGQVTVSNTNGHVDIQMPDANTLKAEYGQGSCPANPSFSNPATYMR